ncbi:hypothetical protein Arth_1013 [Arthrobacter sp. FB24]|nr:hypothetical protein Arth_1013 [Arthrobacter sp. FB24]
MMRKWFGRKGVVVVSTDNNGASKWKISDKKEYASVGGSQLQDEVYTSAACHAPKRGILIFVEVPQEKVRRWRDLGIPIVISLLIGVVSVALAQVSAGPEIARLSLTALLYGIAVTLALGHAGWVLGRAFGRARRLHPMGKTVFKQHWKLLAGIVTSIGSGLIIAIVVPDQSRMQWAVNAYQWWTHPGGAAAQFLGVGWISLGFLAWEVIRGFTASRMLAAFNGVRQQQYRADRPVRGQLYSWWQWRVDLANFECPSATCAKHPRHPPL